MINPLIPKAAKRVSWVWLAIAICQLALVVTKMGGFIAVDWWVVLIPAILAGACLVFAAALIGILLFLFRGQGDDET